VVGDLSDTKRVMANRVLRIAPRGRDIPSSLRARRFTPGSQALIPAGKDLNANLRA
jgi:hypothetical protein